MPAILVDDLMDTAQDVAAPTAVSAVADAGAGAATSSSASFTVLATDARGSLLAQQLPPSPPVPIAGASAEASGSAPAPRAGAEPRLVLRARGAGVAKGDLAVQKTATGSIGDLVQVTALARKAGTIDIVQCDPSNSASVEQVLTLRNPDMKVGMHRWVGLAVAHDGLFACTSAGDMRFFPVAVKGNMNDKDRANGRSVGGNSLECDDSTIVRRELPEPLQSVAFEPPSAPRLFAYGGEEVPLSVWDARKAITPPEATHNNVDDTEKQGAAPSAAAQSEDGELTGKAKKRKRAAENRAKAAELHWGELWRAKNLPNDALSLPQRADILCIAPLRNDKWAVGTRAGLVRVFDTAQQRKHVREFRVFDHEKAPVKNLALSHAGTELVASDTTGRIFVVDWRSGAVLYSYKGITGTVTSLQVLPPMTVEPADAHLVSASADRLVRLHTLPMPTAAEAHDEERRMTKRKGTTLASVFMRDGVTTVAWDGVVPQGRLDHEHTSKTGRNGRAAERGGVDRRATGEDASGDDEDEDDDVWDRMATIEQHGAGRRRTTASGADDDHEERDDAETREARSKRRR